MIVISIAYKMGGGKAKVQSFYMQVNLSFTFHGICMTLPYKLNLLLLLLLYFTKHFFCSKGYFFFYFPPLWICHNFSTFWIWHLITFVGNIFLNGLLESLFHLKWFTLSFYSVLFILINENIFLENIHINIYWLFINYNF